MSDHISSVWNKQLNTKLTSNSPIGENNLKPIGTIGNSRVVDYLLEDYKELIDPAYKKWFAAKFYKIPFDAIHRAASEAKNDGKDPRKLFAYLIKQLCLAQ